MEFSDQLILWATLIGAVATLPTLLEFMIDRKKVKESIALSLDVIDAKSMQVKFAGFNHLLEDIADLIDRAKFPQTYSKLKVGNEVIIIGPSQSGKKMLAMKIAQEVGMDKIIVVYNPRNSDALAKAQVLIKRSKHQKVMLLLPKIDQVYGHEDEETMTELWALVESASTMPKVLVVGTASAFQTYSDLDNLFGIKIVLPGMKKAPFKEQALTKEVRPIFADVAKFYLEEATKNGFSLKSITEEAVVEKILEAVDSPADIEDILSLCQTTALFQQRSKQTDKLEITPAIIDRAIKRVCVKLVSKAN